LARILHFWGYRQGARVEWTSIMDPKLAMLLVLFSTIIGLSYLRAEHLERLRRQFAARGWRKSVPAQGEI
jgi:hypothetical protein